MSISIFNICQSQSTPPGQVNPPISTTKRTSGSSSRLSKPYKERVAAGGNKNQIMREKLSSQTDYIGLERKIDSTKDYHTLYFNTNEMELNLIKVYDPTLLSSSKVYQINGTLSRYLGDEGSIQHPQYLFVPLPNQRKKASFGLNRNKLMTRCYEVEGMVYQKPVVQDNSQQLQLFGVMSTHKPPVIKRPVRLQNSSTKVIYRATTDIQKLRNSHKVEIATIKGQPCMVRETGTYWVSGGESFAELKVKNNDGGE